MRISARNKIKAEIRKIENQGLIADLELKTLERSTLTAVITRESADLMNLQEGEDIKIIIKPTEIIIKELD
ncbi:MAG: molybdenum-pterin-binding protein [Candidatus Lokiarchaeota archaeon]|nr:molybdenum-pterin-binding protein [Candidatus Lokiarchaeota archaeon]